MIKHTQSTAFLDSLCSDPPLLPFLTSLKAHHQETFEHSRRVALLSIDLGYENNLLERDLQLIGYGGLLHDLGKNCISLDILASGQELTEEERTVIKAHSRLGFVQLKDFKPPQVKQIVIAHHEYKTTPYPRSGKDRRKKALIPRICSERRKTDNHTAQLAQIIAAADMYDALKSKRCYKPPMPPEKVESILRAQYAGDQKYIDQLLSIHLQS